MTRLVAEWRRLFDAFVPNYVLCDHSPTALVALRGLQIKRGVIGMGFCCPPESAFDRPLVDVDDDVADARASEERLLANVNGAVDRGTLPLGHLSDLFGDVDSTFLMTYAELDHFPDRRCTEYRGAVIPKMGDAVEWPATRYPMVLVYNREFPALAGLLDFVN